MQHIRNLVIFVLITFFTYTTFAQNVTIKGEAINAVGKKIRLIKYSDHITETEEQLASDVIAKDKSFKLECDVKETILAFLYIDYYGAEIYLEPGATYEIKISEIDFYSQKMNTSFFEKKNLIYDFIEQDTTELNVMIWKLNYLAKVFVSENLREIAYNKNSSKIDSFKLMLKNSYGDIDNRFFNNSMKYKIAQIENTVRRWRKEIFYEDYFYNKPILYENPEYMICFNQFFNRYIIANSGYISRDDLVKTVNEQVSYKALIDSIGKDSILRNQAIRELVLLRNVKSFYYEPDFNKESVLEILRQMIQQSKFKEHKIIANNLIKKLTKLYPGTSAPNFSLKNQKGKAIKLASFKGKYICLFFFSLKSTACLAEMPIVERIDDENDDIIEFICITTDNQYDINSFLKKSGYKWTFLQFADDFEIFNNYDIQTVPFFILIDPDRKIVKYDAIRPSQGFENWFINLFRARE